MRSKQLCAGQLLSAQQRFQQRRIVGAFLEMVGALPGGRPEPRSWWNNAARTDNPVPPKGYDAVLAGQITLQAAIASGDAHVIEETARRVEHYFDELKAAALAPYLERTGGSVEMPIMATSRETADVLAALPEIGLRRGCRATLERVLREGREAVTQLLQFNRSIERELATAAPRTHATGARS